jgi:hypothetical protein
MGAEQTHLHSCYLKKTVKTIDFPLPRCESEKSALFYVYWASEIYPNRQTPLQYCNNCTKKKADRIGW